MTRTSELINFWKEKVEERKAKINKWSDELLKQDEQNYVVDPNLAKSILFFSQMTEELGDLLEIAELLEKRIKKIEKTLNINQIYD